MRKNASHSVWLSGMAWPLCPWQQSAVYVQLRFARGNRTFAGWACALLALEVKVSVGTTTRLALTELATPGSLQGAVRISAG